MNQGTLEAHRHDLRQPQDGPTTDRDLSTYDFERSNWYHMIHIMQMYVKLYIYTYLIIII